jgi:hypothetical protein
MAIVGEVTTMTTEEYLKSLPDPDDELGWTKHHLASTLKTLEVAKETLSLTQNVSTQALAVFNSDRSAREADVYRRALVSILEYKGDSVETLRLKASKALMVRISNIL